ncbi:hypothetical protein HHI36_004583 [Cryptolaemus montrouzieri]|uniref:Uncharacterized protein n=1 Tax=Cryptolaemus montrouzieri TaxID=559131 RepID=A0ABD2NRN2_9CUCU
MNHINKGKMQTRNTKRKKGESSKNTAKKVTSSDVTTKDSVKILCQKEAPSTANTSSASYVSNIEVETEMKSTVPNNLNDASTSATFDVEIDGVPPNILGNKKQRSSRNRTITDTSDESASNEESFSQNNNHEDFEEELKCSICSEIFINAVTLNCSHSFCKYCILRWRKNNQSCPICRQTISSQTSTLVLDKCVAKVFESSNEETKKHRREIMDYREENKEPDIPFPQLAVNGPALININADQIYLDDISDEDYYDYVSYNDSDDYDEDYFDNDGGGDYDETGDYGEDAEDYVDDIVIEQGDVEHEEEDVDQDEEYDYEVDGYYEEEENEEADEDYDSVDGEEDEYDEEESCEDVDESDSEDEESNDDGRYGLECFNCGQIGHLARNCPTRVPYTGRPGAYYGGYGSCFKCSQDGHWANGCPN